MRTPNHLVAAGARRALPPPQAAAAGPAASPPQAAPASARPGTQRRAGPFRRQVARVAALPRQAIGVEGLAKWATAAAVFLAISKFHGYVSVLAKIRTPLILSVIALIAMMADSSKWRPGDLSKHWMPKLVGIMLVVAVAGIPFALHKSNSLTTINEVFSRTLLLAMMIWGVARNRRGLEFMTSTVLLACVCAAWMAFLTGRTDSAGRLAGGYSYDPNDIALIGVVGMPLAVWWALTPGRPFRGAMLLALPLFVRLVVKSDSRGGFLGMIAVLAAFFVMSMAKAHRRLKYTGWVITAVAVGSFVVAPNYFIKKYNSIMDPNDYNRTSPRGRKQVWERGMGYAFSNPVLGVGIGNFGSAEGRSDAGVAYQASGRGWKWGTAHNSFVQVAAELGLIAGSAFLLLFLRGIYELVSVGKVAATRGDLLPPFLAMALVGFATSAFFLSWGYYDLTYALLALACATLMQNQDLLAWARRLRQPKR